MRSLTHFVPTLAVASALFSGCYASDGRSGAGDAGPSVVDAGRPVDGGATDAGAAVDASPPPLLCPEVRADFACFESFAIPAAVPTTVEVSFDTCACCPDTECAVAVDHAGRVVRLTTTLCPDPCDCATCNTPVAQCELPALANGTWRFEVNGGSAFVVGVRESGGPVEPGGCVVFAEDDACTPDGDVVRGALVRTTRACARPVPDSEQRWEVEVSDDCGGCQHDGPCTAVVTERLTADLPPGYDIRLETRGYQGACDGACPEVCMPYQRTCALPPLPDGLHRLVVDRGPVLTFETGGPRETVCTEGAL